MTAAVVPYYPRRVADIEVRDVRPTKAEAVGIPDTRDARVETGDVMEVPTTVRVQLVKGRWTVLDGKDESERVLWSGSSYGSREEAENVAYAIRVTWRDAWGFGFDHGWDDGYEGAYKAGYRAGTEDTYKLLLDAEDKGEATDADAVQ